MADSPQKKTDQKTKLKARPVASREYPKRSGIEAIFDPQSQAIRVPTAPKKPQRPQEPKEKRASSPAPKKSDQAPASKAESSEKPQVRKPSEKKDEKSDQLKMVVGILLIVVGAWFFIGGGAGAPRDLSPAEQAATNQRIDYHRADTGRRMNRERMNVEIENEQAGTNIPWDAKPVKDADMMQGLPLEQEALPRTTSRDRLVVTNPDDPEARIQYTIREQQQLGELEKAQQKAYIDEFIRNAAQQGIKVEVDKFGNATVVGRLPAQDGSGRSRPGSIR